MPMITGIHHVSLLISSEKALAFYKLLGFREIFRKSRANDTLVLLEGYTMQLEVFVDSRHPYRVIDLNEPLGPRHIALAVNKLEDEIQRLKESFNEKLGDFDPDFQNISTDWTGERYVFFKDPDGNIVELHE